MKVVVAAIGLQACFTVSFLTAQAPPQKAQPPQQTQQPPAKQQPGPQPATATLNPASLTFSGQAVNSTSASQSVTITNSGGAALSVTIAVTGANFGDFKPTNNCGSSVAAGENCSISVVFTPTEAGNRTATLTITAGTAHTVDLKGSATAAAPKGTTGGAAARSEERRVGK